MSLDVSLVGEKHAVKCVCHNCGHEHSREEAEQFYSANITHNTNKMAQQVGIYQHLWRPDEIGITKAKDLIEPLKTGLALMRSDPERFRFYDAPNRWGTYEDFVPWVADYLEACILFPEAYIEVSR